MNGLLIVILLMLIAGAGLILAGVFLLLGSAWAMIGGGVASIALAYILRGGLVLNG